MAELPDQAKELRGMVDALISDLHSDSEAMRDMIKTRITFWDKLVVLNAGTLALSFSAAASLHGRTAGDGGVGYLLASWKLLCVSIGLALFAQWAANNSMARNYIYLSANVLKRKFALVIEKAESLGAVFDVKNPHYVSILKKAEDDSGSLERWSQWAGLAAAILTTGAYYWLYRFASTNFLHL